MGVCVCVCVCGCETAPFHVLSFPGCFVQSEVPHSLLGGCLWGLQVREVTVNHQCTSPGGHAFRPGVMASTRQRDRNYFAFAGGGLFENVRPPNNFVPVVALSIF